LTVDIEKLAAAVVTRGGLASHEQRRRVWPRLLNLDTSVEKLASDFQRLKQQAKTETADDVVEAFRVIAADVPRTPLPGKVQAATLTAILECFAVSEESVRYAQGMADIAALFAEVFDGDDALCYAGFAAFMRQQRMSFLRDISVGLLVRLKLLGNLLRVCDAPVWGAMKSLNATDCIWTMRLAAVLLFRELDPQDAAQLVDVLMAHPDNDYILYVVAACLLTRRKQILAAKALDDLLLVTNGLKPGTVELTVVLTHAAQLHKRVHSSGTRGP
jgi:hypothetical protein